ncbi:MAG: Glycerol-3-phosphate dehydrogenase [NAD(P)+] [Myxococcota bacterium]|nr:Glycerol-3-phosphate dehydrogenase [NAD(P)+] [Myxococcota bacterium]
MSTGNQVLKIGVIGAGSWGTALAKLLADQGRDVLIWSYEAEVARQINDSHENLKYLPGVPLPANLRATNDIEACVYKADCILQVNPSHVVRNVMGGVAKRLPDHAPIVSASKGIENDSLMTMSEVLEDVLPERLHPYLVYLSGPSFAREVAEGMPTAVTLAAHMERVAKRVQGIIHTPFFRTYISNDVAGVEVAGACKNVIAIAAGAVDGMGFGHNTKATVITRGIAEISRLASAKGANPLTLMGLSGLGDLVLTCTGHLSRNRGVGQRLGKGDTLEQVLGDMTMVAEGVKNARSVHDLAARLGVEMPISDAVYSVIYEKKDIQQAIIDLMARQMKREH